MRGLTSRLTITREMIEASRDHPGAFVAAIRAEREAAWRAWQEAFDRLLWEDGAGALDNVVDLPDVPFIAFVTEEGEVLK